MLDLKVLLDQMRARWYRRYSVLNVESTFKESLIFGTPTERPLCEWQQRGLADLYICQR